ncbi:MAG: response regulator transcription factor [Bacteroidota bacterium]
MENIQLAIVEDDPVIQESLEKYLGANPAIQIQLVENSVESFLEKVSGLRPPAINMVLLDIGLPGMTGLDGISHIKEKYPAADIVMLTTFEEDDKIFKALCSGACSYITKRTSLLKIQEALFTIYRGGSYMSPSIARKVVQYFMPKEKKKKAVLTARQQQIVQGLVDGLSYKMIADQYNISLDTVRDHIKRIYRTLQVNSKAEIIRKSLEGEI